jgi:hypothetical protein
MRPSRARVRRRRPGRVDEQCGADELPLPKRVACAERGHQAHLSARVPVGRGEILGDGREGHLRGRARRALVLSIVRGETSVAEAGAQARADGRRGSLRSPHYRVYPRFSR